jgi:hypothetical protein
MMDVLPERLTWQEQHHDDDLSLIAVDPAQTPIGKLEQSRDDPEHDEYPSEMI